MTSSTSSRVAMRFPVTVQAAIGAVVFLALMAMPFMVSSSIMFRIGGFICAALLALSFNLLFGATGLISFAHGALFALGGYAIGIGLRNGLDWPVALAVAVLAGAAVGFVFSFLALRVSGVYFSIITLALGEIIHIVLLQWSEVTGGDNGLSGIAPGEWMGINLNDQVFYFWAVVVLATVGAVLLKVLTDSRFGRTLTAIREDPVRASYLGVPVRRYRAMAFTYSATFAVFAGALFGPLVGLMVPSDAGLLASSEPILATLLGGINNFLGPVVGAGVFALVEYFARDLASLRLIITGVLLLVVILIAPGGITGTFGTWLRNRLARRGGDSGSGGSATVAEAPEGESPGSVASNEGVQS